MNLLTLFILARFGRYLRYSRPVNLVTYGPRVHFCRYLRHSCSVNLVTVDLRSIFVAIYSIPARWTR